MTALKKKKEKETDGFQVSFFLIQKGGWGEGGGLAFDINTMVGVVDY